MHSNDWLKLTTAQLNGNKLIRYNQTTTDIWNNKMMTIRNNIQNCFCRVINQNNQSIAHLVDIPKAGNFVKMSAQKFESFKVDFWKFSKQHFEFQKALFPMRNTAQLNNSLIQLCKHTHTHKWITGLFKYQIFNDHF